MHAFALPELHPLHKKKIKTSVDSRNFLFIATILFGMVFSYQAQAQTCTPPRTGPTTSSGSGTLTGPAGTTFIIAGSSSDPFFSGTSTASMSPGGSYTGPGCAGYTTAQVGFYTTAVANESYTWTTVVSYGGSITIGPNGTAASPKNLGEQNPVCSANTCEGNPMNVGVGNKFQVETDFVGAPSIHLELKRYYNNQAVTPTTFGQNWSSTYSRSVVNPTGASSPSYVQLFHADGRIDTFRLQSGAWVADPDVRTTLTAVMSGTTQTGWQAVNADDTVENYTMGGQLTSIVTRAGLTTTLAYNTSGQLTTVTGPFGHTLTYTYNTNGNVATVTLPDGGVLHYSYGTSNHLTSVTYPDSTTRSYSYTNSLYPNGLTQLTDELGNAYASWTYASSPYFPSAGGIVTSSQHAGGVDLTSVAYSFSGQVTVTDPNSNNHVYTITNQFGVGKPSSLTGQPVASVGGKSFSYDTNGFISSRTDYDNNVTHYTHDTRGDETSRTEAFGTTLARTISTTWHSTFHLPLTITEPNRTTTFTYDTSGNLLTKTVTAGSASRVWTYTYNTSGQVLTAEDPDSNFTDYAYNTNGTLATVTDALGHVTSFTSYDADGRLLSMTDPNGLVTSFTYDARGRLTSRTVGTLVTTYTYDHAGNLTRVTQPDGSYLAYTYDAAHRLTQVTDALGNFITYALDAASNVTAKRIYTSGSVLAWQRSFTYDSVERLHTAVGAYTGETTTYAYDSQSNLTSVTDPLSHVYTYTYDALNRRTKVTNPASGVTQYGFDANDHITSVTDPRSLVTSYTVTGLDNVTGISSPDTGAKSNTYDAAGNVATSTDANGNVVTYTYDALNRVTNAAYTGGANVAYTYDTGTNGIGHLTGMTDPAGTTAWAYDLFGHVVQKQQQATGGVILTTSYSYDAYGRLADITYPSGVTISLSYDADGHVNGMATGGAWLVASIGYMPFGGAAQWTEGNGASYARAIDLDGRISGIGFGTIGGAVSLGYTIDTANRITALTETGLANKTFGYDTLNRLTSFVNGTSTTSYAYDADSNRTSVGTTTYSYPSTSNRLSSAGSTTYSYDSNGNITSDGSNTWTYDARNRMASDAVSILTVDYGVNGLGQRITKTTPAVPPANVNNYVYDERGHLLGEYDGAGNTLQETVWLGDVPVAAFTVSGTSVTPYYHNPDNLNAPHTITDGSGNPVWTWDHLAFGDNPPNQNPSGLGVFNYNVRFPGQYADAESGLNNNMARDYSSSLGRYIESDPIGLNGGINTYGYVKGNPLIRADATGELWPQLIGVGIVGGIMIIENMNFLSHPPEIPQTPLPPPPAGKFCSLYDPRGLSIPSGAVVMNPVPAPETQPEIPEPPEPPEWPSD